MIKLENEAIKVFTDYDSIYIKEAMNVYKYLNKKTFEAFTTINLFKPVLDVIFNLYKQSPKVTYFEAQKPVFVSSGKSVLVACSSGLDSVYQALYLRNQGYDVTLLHLENCNYYTNGLEKKVFLEFAKRFNFKYFMPKISPKQKSEYKKEWQENSFKNFLIYSLSLVYMLKNNIHCLSSGDDLRLDISEAMPGTNDGDSHQETEAFMQARGIDFIPVKSNINKAMRLAYIRECGAGDYYISSVGPGRLNQMLHNKYEKEFNVKLDKYNAASDRKDCMHILLDKYYNHIDIPKALEDRCWEKVSKGADNVFFDKKISLRQRIKNLIEY